MRNPNHKRKPKHSKVKYKVVYMFDSYLGKYVKFMKMKRINCRKKSHTSSMNKFVNWNEVHKYRLFKITLVKK